MSRKSAVSVVFRRDQFSGISVDKSANRQRTSIEVVLSAKMEQFGCSIKLDMMCGLARHVSSDQQLAAWTTTTVSKCSQIRCSFFFLHFVTTLGPWKQKSPVHSPTRCKDKLFLLHTHTHTTQSKSSHINSTAWSIFHPPTIR